MARKSALSMAELIRGSIDQYVRSARPVVSEEERRRAVAVVGRFRSGASDISVEHDRYLEEAFGDWVEKGRERGNLR